MIKSKSKKRYYGVLAYSEGLVGRIIEHSIVEDADGLNETFTISNGEGFNVSNQVICIEKLHFVSKDNVIIAIAKVDGRKYVGYAILNPADKEDDRMFGRSLAVARALQDNEQVQYLLKSKHEENKVE